MAFTVIVIGSQSDHQIISQMLKSKTSKVDTALQKINWFPLYFLRGTGRRKEGGENI